MLKQTITYIDYDNVEQTDTLWFNISPDEVLDVRHLIPRFQALDAIMPKEGEDPRDLTLDEIAEVRDVIKELMRFSYGERLDAKHFDKSPELWTKFTQTAAYSAYLLNLFQDIDNGMEFMKGVWPREVVAGLDTANMQTVELPQPEHDGHIPVVIEPAWIREDRDPTSEEVRSMSREQMNIAWQRKTQRDLK